MRGGVQRTVYLSRQIVGCEVGADVSLTWKDGDKRNCRRSNLRPTRAWVTRAMKDPEKGVELTRIALETWRGPVNNAGAV
jgi:hypothetical protein